MPATAPEVRAELKRERLLSHLKQALRDALCANRDENGVRAEYQYRQGLLIHFLRQRLTSQEVLAGALKDFVSCLSLVLCPGEQEALRKLSLPGDKQCASDASTTRKRAENGCSGGSRLLSSESSITENLTAAGPKHLPSRPSQPRPEANSPRKRQSKECSRENISKS